MRTLKILIAGLGNMGKSHALACNNHPGFEVVGLVNRSPVELPDSLSGIAMYTNFHTALAQVECDVVSIQYVF